MCCGYVSRKTSNEVQLSLNYIREFLHTRNVSKNSQIIVAVYECVISI